MEALAHALEIAPISEDEDVLFQAADYMDRGMTAFDAYHAAYAKGDPILSSDRRFDSLDNVERVPLEPSDDA